MNREAYDRQYYFDLTCYVYNLICLISSVVLCAFIVSSCVLKLRGSNRLSFKLYFWIGFSDLVNNLFAYFVTEGYMRNYTGYNEKVKLGVNVWLVDSRSCALVYHFTQFSNTYFVMLTLGLAFNLHMVFLRRKYFPILTHHLYNLFALGISTVVVLPSLIFGLNKGICGGFVDESNGILKPIWFVGMFTLPVILVCVYCLYVFISVVIHLNNNRKLLNNALVAKKFSATPTTKVYTATTLAPNAPSPFQPVTPTPSPAATNLNLAISLDKFAARLVLYALIPILTQMPYILIYVSGVKYFKNMELKLAINLIGFSSGLLNFIAFCFDPAIPSILLSFKQKYCTKLTDTIELNLRQRQTEVNENLLPKLNRLSNAFKSYRFNVPLKFNPDTITSTNTSEQSISVVSKTEDVESYQVNKPLVNGELILNCL